MVSQRSVEPKIHGTEDRIHTAATLGWLQAGHWTEIFPSYEVKDGDIRRAVAAIADLPSSTLPDSPFILALVTPAAQNVPPQTGTLAQRALEEWERTLCENKAVVILAQMQAGRPALIQKDGGELLIAIVLDRPLADAKALVDDLQLSLEKWPRFCSKGKVNHLLRKWLSQQEGVTHLPQTAQLAPAGMNTPAPVRPCSSSSLKRLTWGTHGCHTRRVTTVQHRCCHYGVPMVDWCLVDLGHLLYLWQLIV